MLRKTALLVVVVCLFSACEVVTQSVVLQTDLGEIVPTNGEKRSLFEYGNESSALEYCKKRIIRAGAVPFGFERRRGPFQNLTARYKPERYEGSTASSTCNLDYYYWPVNKKAFENMDIEYRYNKAVWSEFHEAVSASISAQLETSGWIRVEEKAEADTVPDVEMMYSHPEYPVTEFLDVYFTKDEEVQFELLVMDWSK